MTARKTATGPTAFDPGDARVVVEDVVPATESEPTAGDDGGGTEAIATNVRPARTKTVARGFGWGGVLLSALGGLATLALGVWLQGFVADLLVREGWLGWLALALVAIAGLAATVLALREIAGIAHLRRLGRTRQSADAAIRHGDDEEARRAAGGITRLYRGRDDTRWALARIERHRREVLTGTELLTLMDRELGRALDHQARTIVAGSARRVSVLTALSPAAVLDMLFVGAETLAMIRRLATLYGGRPGFFGLFRLARRVLTHIVLTGGIAFALDMAHDILGKRLVGIVAGRLGEGFFNGALTARLGLAAIEVCRPLPHIETKPPGLKGIVAEIASSARRSKRSDQGKDRNRETAEAVPEDSA